MHETKYIKVTSATRGTEQGQICEASHLVLVAWFQLHLETLHTHLVLRMPLGSSKGQMAKFEPFCSLSPMGKPVLTLWECFIVLNQSLIKNLTKMSPFMCFRTVQNYIIAIKHSVSDLLIHTQVREGIARAVFLKRTWCKIAWTKLSISPGLQNIFLKLGFYLLHSQLSKVFLLYV